GVKGRSGTAAPSCLAGQAPLYPSLLSPTCYASGSLWSPACLATAHTPPPAPLALVPVQTMPTLAASLGDGSRAPPHGRRPPGPPAPADSAADSLVRAAPHPGLPRQIG